MIFNLKVLKGLLKNALKMQNKISPYCTFYIVRHGQSEGNIKGIVQGQADFALTEKGNTEAVSFVSTLRHLKFDAIFSSDLKRAYQTAIIFAKEYGLMIKKTKLLREQNFGRYNGTEVMRFRSELKELLHTHRSLSPSERFVHKIIDDIESDKEMMSRFLRFFKKTATDFLQKKVLVVTHGAMMRTLLIHLNFATYPELTPETLKNLGYFILDFNGTDFLIREVHGVEKNNGKV